MKLSGGEIVVRALEAEGIRWSFGIPGTHNIELYDALGASSSTRAVLVTDEQSASFMADGVWRASGEMACVNVVPGAGLTHALSGIAEAFMDNVPMLVLGCGIRRDSGLAYQLHDVDQARMVAPVSKGTFLPMNGEELYGQLREACALAREGTPGPVFVEVPANLYLFKHDVELRWSAGGAPGSARTRSGTVGSGDPSTGLPDGPRAPGDLEDAARRAAEILAASERPLVYLGAGARRGRSSALRLVELLQAPFSTTFQGKGILPETHPLFLWPGFGDAAPPFVREEAGECDVTLAVGCRFGEVATGSYGMEPVGRLIHVDIDGDVLNANYPAELAVQADAGAFLDALLEALGPEAQRPPDDRLRARIRQGHEEVWEDWREDVGGERVTPAHLIRVAQDVFGPSTVYTTDSGNGTFLAMEQLRLVEPGKFLAPVDYSCMGYSVPAAIGAKLARPDDAVVALAGDGAFLMTGLELITAAQEGIGVVALVLRDRELAQIAQFQGTAMNRKVASVLSEYDLESLAAGMGCAFLRLEDDASVREVLTEARSRSEEGRPVVVDVAIDYSRKTFFTKGVVKSNLLRFPLKDRLRFIGRAVVRRVTG